MPYNTDKEDFMLKFPQGIVEGGLERGLQKLEAAREERNAALRAQAKSYEELLRPVECTVLSALIQYHSHSHTPLSERRIGGHSPSYNTGQSAHLELRVSCSEYPVIETLHFRAAAPVEKGDRIRAYIIKGEEKNLEISFSEQLNLERYNHDIPSVLIEREYTSKEETLKIEKLDMLGDVLITYELSR